MLKIHKKSHLVSDSKGEPSNGIKASELLGKVAHRHRIPCLEIVRMNHCEMLKIQYLIFNKLVAFYLEHRVLFELDVAVNVAGHLYLGAVHHLLHLDPQQLGDVQLGEDEDRPEEEDVDGQDDQVDVDP